MMRKMSMYILMKRSASAEYLLKSFSSVAFRQPEPHDLSSQLYSIFSRRDLQECPSLKKLLLSVYPTRVCPLYFSLKKSNNLDPTTALGFHNWIAQRPDYKYNVQCHVSLLVNVLIPNINNGGLLRVAKQIQISMIEGCDSVEDVRFVLNVLRQIKSGSMFKLDVIGYNTLLITLQKFKLIDELKSVFMEMLGDLVAPNILTFHLMVMAYCEMGNVAEAESYVSEMVKMGLTLYTITYNLLMMGHVRNKDVDSALKVFDLISQEGCRRDAFSYDYIITHLCLANQVYEAFKCFSRMGPDDNCSTLRKSTYEILIYSFLGLGEINESLNLFMKMIEKGYEPSATIYSAAIIRLYQQEKFDEAKKILIGMLKKHMVPSSFVYQLMIIHCCTDGMVDEAFEILCLVESNNCFPRAGVIDVLICAYCRKANLQMARILVNKMLHHKLSPSMDAIISLRKAGLNSAELHKIL